VHLTLTYVNDGCSDEEEAVEVVRASDVEIFGCTEAARALRVTWDTPHPWPEDRSTWPGL
jgi:hypothetical protein